MTTFREIPGYPNYFATEDGLIIKIRKDGTTLTLSQRKDSKGYLRVNLYIEGNVYTRFVHQLIALAFLVEEPLEEVNHKDGDKTNNHYLNLEWVTRVGNRIHAVNTGLVRNVLRVRAYHNKSGEVIVYPSMKSAAKAFGLDRYQIVKFLTGYPHLKVNGDVTLQAMLEEYVPNTREGRRTIVAYDYVSKRTLVADTTLMMALLTGIQNQTIKGALKAKKMNLIGGYAFKKGEDQTPFPKFDKDEAFSSRERYMLQYKN